MGGSIDAQRSLIANAGRDLHIDGAQIINNSAEYSASSTNIGVGYSASGKGASAGNSHLEDDSSSRRRVG